MPIILLASEAYKPMSATPVNMQEGLHSIIEAT